MSGIFIALIIIVVPMIILFLFEDKEKENASKIEKNNPNFTKEPIKKENFKKEFPKIISQEETPVLNKLLGINTNNVNDKLNNNISKNKSKKLEKLESTVIFLNWVNGKSILDKEQYPVYFFYEYSIKDCVKFHKELVEKSFLEKANFENYLNNRLVIELKEILTKHKLKKTGNKVDLIKRIIDNVKPEDIEFQSQTYMLSEKGKEFLKINHFILEIRGTSISVEEFLEEKSKIDIPCFTRDIMWSIYNKKSLEYFFRKDFGLYCIILSEMVSFLYKENNLRLALVFLLRILYCDLSGMRNNNFLSTKDILFINPNVAQGIYELGSYFYKGLLDQCFITKFPFHYCNEEIFSNIVNDILLGEDSETILEKYLDKMKKGPISARILN